jgi:hypothetical protein
MKYTKLLIVLAFFATIVSTALARTEVMSGKCPDGIGGTWITILTIDDQGRVIDAEGITCGGTHWVGHCSVHVLPTNPSNTSMYYFTGDSGSWVRCNLTANGEISEVWGKDIYGNYWSADVDENNGNLL